MRDFHLSPAAEAEIETELFLRGGKMRGSEIIFLCPSHADTNPSASYNTEKHVWVCRVCGSKGGYRSLTEALGWE